MDWLKLKSGSDVRGVAVGDSAVITPDLAMALGMAFVEMLSERKNKPQNQIVVAIGRDSRNSGPELL